MSTRYEIRPQTRDLGDVTVYGGATPPTKQTDDLEARLGTFVIERIDGTWQVQEGSARDTVFPHNTKWMLQHCSQEYPNGLPTKQATPKEE